MKQKLKVYDYATTMRISVPTVYRHIKAGKLETETIDGVLYVIVDEEQLNNIEEQDDLIAELKTRIEQQQNEIEYLRGELSSARQRTDQIIQQMQQDTESDKQRSDTIILQLTRQFEAQTKLIEDMRHRSLWARVKTAFGFATS